MSEVSTIFALSSGRGRAGVAVIRISGPSARQVLERMAAPCPPPRRAAFRRIVDPVSGELLDAALVLFFAGPGSETGEDIAELQLHGSPAVVSAVLRALGTCPGCRLAEPGEFARRAFLNGKIDLTAAEGLADLIDAETDAQRRQALAQAGGAFARVCEDWRQRLLEARALTEASIDFSDEPDVAADALDRARAIARPLLDDVNTHLAGAHRGEIVRDGFRVVLAGAPNAGKSSLINILAKRDIAIVSDEPGTTRDLLQVHLDLAGYAVVMTDTAGLREAGSVVEREGMRRARTSARDADLVVWLADAAQPVWPPSDLVTAEERLLVVLNKIDLLPAGMGGPPAPAPPAPAPSAPPLRMSTRTGEGIATLLDIIGQRIAEAVDRHAASVVPTQERHRLHLLACAEALSRALSLPQPESELAAEDLRLAGDALGRITGRVDAEEVLGQIFGRFCIGK